MRAAVGCLDGAFQRQPSFSPAPPTLLAMVTWLFCPFFPKLCPFPSDPISKLPCCTLFLLQGASVSSILHTLPCLGYSPTVFLTIPSIYCSPKFPLGVLFLFLQPARADLAIITFSKQTRIHKITKGIHSHVRPQSPE